MTRSATSAVLLSLLIGGVTGLRTMTGPAAVSWAARLGGLNLAPTSLAFLGSALTSWTLTLLALGELVVDQLPRTPSRTVPMQFAARLIAGGLSGAGIGAAGGIRLFGLLAGVAGAVAGTLGGHHARLRLAAWFGSDRPAALIEDGVAIGGALLVIAALL